jgi:hypothetical protein
MKKCQVLQVLLVLQENKVQLGLADTEEQQEFKEKVEPLVQQD